jgi:hypothetical protein
MKTKLEFQNTILEHLQSSSYVLIDPINLDEEQAEYELLFDKKAMKELLPRLKKITGLSSIRIATNFSNSKAILSFKDNVDLMVNFIHKFAYRSMIYLDEVEVLNRRVKTAEGYYLPCVEHLFEQRVLQSFLQMRGIGKTTFSYFSEFHILVQEDLIDYFNAKYGTSFSSLYQLTDFDNRQREQIVRTLKTLPLNGIFKSVKHTFLSYIKQARII